MRSTGALVLGGQFLLVMKIKGYYMASISKLMIRKKILTLKYYFIGQLTFRLADSSGALDLSFKTLKQE